MRDGAPKLQPEPRLNGLSSLDGGKGQTEEPSYHHIESDMTATHCIDFRIDMHVQVFKITLSKKIKPKMLSHPV